MNSKNYKLGCIIYSRMKSSRFPEKAKFKLEGIPLLERVIQRTKKINKENQIIIATSIDKSDNYICDIAKKTISPSTEEVSKMLKEQLKL